MWCSRAYVFFSFVLCMYLRCVYASFWTKHCWLTFDFCCTCNYMYFGNATEENLALHCIRVWVLCAIGGLVLGPDGRSPFWSSRSLSTVFSRSPSSSSARRIAAITRESEASDLRLAANKGGGGNSALRFAAQGWFCRWSVVLFFKFDSVWLHFCGEHGDTFTARLHPCKQLFPVRTCTFTAFEREPRADRIGCVTPDPTSSVGLSGTMRGCTNKLNKYMTKINWKKKQTTHTHIQWPHLANVSRNAICSVCLELLIYVLFFPFQKLSWNEKGRRRLLSLFKK